MLSSLAILIPHYNNPDGLKKSLWSVMCSFLPEVVIVDDGSTIRFDETELTNLFSDRMNLHFINHKSNKGVEFALNSGLAYIMQHPILKYIARLDCADTCHPERLDRQINFLKENPEVALVGTWTQFVAPDGKPLFVSRVPAAHADIVKAMQSYCCFIHPSVMFRTDALPTTGLYPLTFKAAEDYAFFYQFVNNFQTANLPMVLTYTEWSPTGISQTRRAKQFKSRINVLRTFAPKNLRTQMGIGRTWFLSVLPAHWVERIKQIVKK